MVKSMGDRERREWQVAVTCKTMTSEHHTNLNYTERDELHE